MTECAGFGLFVVGAGSAMDMIALLQESALKYVAFLMLRAEILMNAWEGMRENYFRSVEVMSEDASENDLVC